MKTLITIIAALGLCFPVTLHLFGGVYCTIILFASIAWLSFELSKDGEEKK